MSTKARSRATEDVLAAVLGSDPGQPTAAAEMAETFDSDEVQLEPDPEALDADLAETGADDQLAEAAPAAAADPHRHAPRARENRGGSGLISLVLGLGCVLGSAALGAGDGAAAQRLTPYGLSPATLLAVGAVAIGIGLVRRQVADTQHQLTALADRQDDLQADLQHSLAQLLEGRAAVESRPPAEGEELQRVFLALQRQDEKVNNLSRALKMYGKPLMEIANHGSDVAGLINQLREHVDGVQTACRGGFEQLREAVAAASNNDEMQQRLGRVDSAVAALDQRLDDGPLRESLARLEEIGRSQQQMLLGMVRAETLQQHAQRIEQLLDGGLGRLEDALSQLRKGELGGLDAAVREMQREFAGMATAVAQLQQAIKKGAIAPAPAAAAVAPPPRPAADAAPAPAPASSSDASTDAAAGVAQNKVGSRATSGKNVLGAIAKLKKMKN